jgi:hypothetical protein
MATRNGDSPESNPNLRWEGYSDYQQVSGGIVRTIEAAVDAYAALDAAVTEQQRIDPGLAADARAAITAASMKLRYELEQDRDVEPTYDDILTRWEGEDGYLQKFDQARLAEGRPAWLYEFVSDIRKAGWELGYLQAGRKSRVETGDETEQQVESMFRE